MSEVKKIKEVIQEKKEAIKVRNEEIKEKLPSKEKASSLTAPKKLKVLFTIVPRNKVDFFLDVLEGYEVNMQTVIFGHGTIPTELAAQLKTNTDKAIILSVIQEQYVKPILNAYEDKYFKIRNGQGIAFTVPFSSIIGKASYQFLANMEDK